MGIVLLIVHLNKKQPGRIKKRKRPRTSAPQDTDDRDKPSSRPAWRRGV
jgi:hypothetical protein